ncbi:hypothetical protein EV426DRAFT_605614 [Tirmania nivea]|nr:hypothetical protein EV426DRAFT_605614 [Tirmania nivea]
MAYIYYLLPALASSRAQADAYSCTATAPARTSFHGRASASRTRKSRGRPCGRNVGTSSLRTTTYSMTQARVYRGKRRRILF